MRSIIKKVALKNTLYFVKYKKDKFLTVNSIRTQVRHFISLLSENLHFLYFLKYKVFLNETFFCRLPVSKSIYIFNHIIFLTSFFRSIFITSSVLKYKMF
jgi:hypothetical protein